MPRQWTAPERLTNDLDFTHNTANVWSDDWASPAAQPAVEIVAPRLAALSAYSVHALGDHPGSHPFIAHHEDNDGSSFVLPRFGAYSGTASGQTTQDTSPSMAAEAAFISGVDSSGHTVGTSFWTWNNDSPATYATRSNDHKWGATASGTAGGTIDYYFDPASNWTATETAQMTACLTLWSDEANIHFALTTNAADAQITFHRGNDGNAVTPAGWSGGSSAGSVGGSTLWTLTSATVSIDTSVPGFGPMDGDFTSIGGYVWQTIVHEIGHAIGLGHGGGYNGSVDSATQQYSAFDNRLWSLMSYINPDDTSAKYFSQYTVTGTDWGTAPDGYGNVPTTPMPLDIVAIQALYGAATTTALSGGQIFGFHCNIADATEPFFDFTKNVNPVVTLWDKGTNNTLDLSGWDTDSTINLNPGTFSSVNGQVNNIGIAFGTSVDSAVGGHGADTFIANADADHLSGGGGGDVFDMGANLRFDDRINGGSNNNTVNVAGDYSTALHFHSATMINVQNIDFAAGNDYNIVTADRTVAADKTLIVDGHTLGASDVLIFNGSKETDGHFTMKGGAGDDVLTGGAQSDTITGGGGSDHLRGGGGHDTFAYTSASDSTSTTHDLILDFDANGDKIDLPFTVAGLSTLTTGVLAGNHFDANLAAAVSTLGNHQAILFTPDSGSLAGHTILVVDVNGTAGYQAGVDYAIDLEHPAHLSSFDLSNFI